jgi:hypothetical protein
MTQRIIYPLDDECVAVIAPAFNCDISVVEIARKDVPANKPYKIIDESAIPTDRTFRDAWEADFSNPDGYGIGADAWFAEQSAKEQA